MKLKLFDLLIVALSLVSCSETDSYTHRNEILSKEFPKINDLLNKLTNIHIQRALSTVKSCSVIDLQSALVKELGDMYLGMGMIDTMIGKLG